MLFKKKRVPDEDYASAFFATAIAAARSAGATSIQFGSGALAPVADETYRRQCEIVNATGLMASPITVAFRIDGDLRHWNTLPYATIVALLTHVLGGKGLPASMRPMIIGSLDFEIQVD
ncbi:MAG TPA: hypothetical protein VEL07_03240 [Planctomycetota bacterium]|nr:hypothetical protein [Planctomycetota bacterium]